MAGHDHGQDGDWEHEVDWLLPSRGGSDCEVQVPVSTDGVAVVDDAVDHSDSHDEDVHWSSDLSDALCDDEPQMMDAVHVLQVDCADDDPHDALGSP